jgi:hypothetical protein
MGTYSCKGSLAEIPRPEPPKRAHLLRRKLQRCGIVEGKNGPLSYQN